MAGDQFADPAKESSRCRRADLQPEADVAPRAGSSRRHDSSSAAACVPSAALALPAPPATCNAPAGTNRAAPAGDATRVLPIAVAHEVEGDAEFPSEHLGSAGCFPGHAAPRFSQWHVVL